jgi:hypothetical protein
MRISKQVGLVLLVMALLGAVAETMAHAQPGVKGVFLSTYDVLYALWPSKLIVAKIHIERELGTIAWDPFVIGFLALPVWLIFGLPGGIFLWLGTRRPGGRRDAKIDELEESLFLFDSLAERAREEGYADDDDDPRFEPQFATAFDARPPAPDLLDGIDDGEDGRDKAGEPGTPENPIVLTSDSAVETDEGPETETPEENNLKKD